MLRQAGLGDSVHVSAQGNGFVRKVNLAHPCLGAVPRKHSHFFTSDGQFGSLDWRGQQVDDGTYEIINENTFASTKSFRT